jgi:predicted KAP-like P-loop ATPase
MSWLSKIFTRHKDTESVEAVIAPSSGLEPIEHDRVGSLAADNPVRQLSDDKLGRTSAAKSFALNVLRLDTSEGVVVGVLGAWGSGKTSFINLARPTFEEDGVPVLDFNPWMFSGAEQLVQSFFSELSAQLKLKPGLVEVGKGLEEYGEMFSGLAWVPIVGPWIERGQDLAKLIENLLQRKKEGVGSQRAKVDKALRALNKPIVVVLDDIDRLNTSEIRDIFRLVRLTANFPNLIYVLAFDRKRVEDALSEEGIPGRAYLEKILQIGFDLPTVPEHVLNQQIFAEIDAALEGIPNAGSFDSNAWPDVFVEVIRPLISNMRDVRRYVAAISGTVSSLEGQIALVDVLALEAVRVFLPDVFQRFPASVSGLTTTSDIGYGGGREQVHLKQEIDDLIDAAGNRAAVVRAMIQRLFMAAQRHVGGSHFGVGIPDQRDRSFRSIVTDDSDRT